jgi:hypothetical protein
MKIQTVREVLDEELPPIHSFVGHGLIIIGGRTLIYGPKGSFKSYLAQSLCFALAAGKDWFGFPVTKKFRTVYIQAEVSPYFMQERTRAVQPLLWPEVEDTMGVYTSRGFQLSKKKDWVEMADACDDFGADFVVLDPISLFVAGTMNDEAMVGALTKGFDFVFEQLGISFGLIHHSGKSWFQGGEEVDRDVDALRGSSILANWADTIIQLRRVRTNLDSTVEMSWQRTRNAKEPPKKLLRLGDDGILRLSENDPRTVTLAILSHGELHTDDLAGRLAEIGVSRERTQELRRDLLSEGLTIELRDPEDKRKVLVKLRS